MVNKGNKESQKKPVQSKSEALSLLKDEVMATLRNGLVYPNTILQVGRDRQLTYEESEKASKYISAVIANVEQKFFNVLNR